MRCSAIEVFVVENVEILLFSSDHLLGNVRVGAFEAQDHRFVEGVQLVGLDNGSGEMVAAKDATKDVDKDGFDFWVVVEELESLGQLLTLGTTTHVEEVGGLASFLLNNVHRGHGQASTVDQATDVSSNMNVVQVERLGVLLASVVLGLILLRSEIFLTEGGIRVNSDFRISGKNLVILGENERIDFNHVAVTSHEAFIDLGEHVHNLVSLFGDTNVCGRLAQVCLVKALGVRHLQFENLFGSIFCNVFNRHSTGRAVNKGGAAGGAIECK